MLRKQTNSLVIRPRISTHYRIAIIASGVLLGLLVVWGVYVWGQSNASAQLTAAKERAEKVARVVDQLRVEKQKLLTGLAQIERQLQIDKTAYEELRGMLETSNSQIMELRNEIKFYRSIISPEDGKSGLRIQDFLLSEANGDGVKYKLVLIQALQHSKEFQGQVSFSLKGLENGDVKVIDLARIGTQPVTVKFKYFQNVTGTLILPKGFKPQEVKVSVSPDKRQSPVVEQWYPWPKA